ncbi:MAG: hypothetical protein MRY83_17075 [Flavobacteriales bacterium]|nr:hypothetical protein [Flavobacteriales bacterium]
MSMINTEEQFNRIIGKQITGIRLFNVNESLFDIKDCDRQIVDGGIEFEFDDGTLFTFGWDPELQLMNYKFNSFAMLYADRFFTLDIQEDFFWKPLFGQIIAKADVHWTCYEDEGIDAVKIPDMILIQTDKGDRFMFGAFKFEVENDTIKKFLVDSEEWLVVFFDQEEMTEVFERNKLLDTSVN